MNSLGKRVVDLMDQHLTKEEAEAFRNAYLEAYPHLRDLWVHTATGTALDKLADDLKISEDGPFEYIGLDEQLRRAEAENIGLPIGRPLEYETHVGRFTGPPQIQTLPREKHKCYCSKDQVNWYGCKCGGV